MKIIHIWLIMHDDNELDMKLIRIAEPLFC